MGDLNGNIFKLLDVDSTKESRARNIHLDQSVYRWASWQGYVQDNEEIVWDEKTTVGLLTASKHRKKKKGQVSYEGEWEEVARDEAEKEWGGVFQHPSEGGVSRGVMGNVKQHTEMLINAVGAKPAFPHHLSVYAAKFPTARTYIALILDFLWFPEPALSIDMEGWKCQGIKACHFPSKSHQLMVAESWCTTISPTLPLEQCNSEIQILHHFPAFPETGLSSGCRAQ